MQIYFVNFPILIEYDSLYFHAFAVLKFKDLFVITKCLLSTKILLFLDRRPHLVVFIRCIEIFAVFLYKYTFLFSLRFMTIISISSLYFVMSKVQ
jgi:hypothetical protein